MSKIDAEVVIVGAGPVGLTAALALARKGVSSILLEREHIFIKDWRASTFHPPTLDAATDLDIIDDMLNEGLRAPIYQMRDHVDGLIVRFDLDVLADETAWPFRLQLEQYKYAKILRRKLGAHPHAEIRLGHKVTGIVQHEDHVVVEVGDHTPLTAQWVIGADGANSAVRELCGVEFEGYTYPSRRLLMSIDAPLDENVDDLDLVNYVYAPGGAGMILRIPDLWRVMVTLPDEITDEAAAQPVYYNERLARLLGGWSPEVKQTQVYKIHQRAAANYKNGRVLLTGDAAHLNSPTGGMGLNSGIHDAIDLVATYTGTDPANRDRSLQAWGVRRKTAAVEEIHRVTNMNTVNLGEPDEQVRRQKQDEMRAVAADPVRTKEYLMDTSMITSTRRIPIGVARVAPYSRNTALELVGGPR